MIQGDGWEEVAHGLVSRGLCQVVPEESLFKVHGEVLLNGLFAVAKDEVKERSDSSFEVDNELEAVESGESQFRG